MKTLIESLLDDDKKLFTDTEISGLNQLAEDKVKKLLINNDALYDQGKFIAANGSGDEALFNYVIALYILYNFVYKNFSKFTQLQVRMIIKMFILYFPEHYFIKEKDGWGYNLDIKYMGTSEIAAKIKELENILALPKITKSIFNKVKPCLFYDGNNSKPYNAITRSVSNDDLDLHEYGFEWTLETIYDCFKNENFPELDY